MRAESRNALRATGGMGIFRRVWGRVGGRTASGADLKLARPRPHAVAIAAAFSNPSSSTASSRILNFCTLPVTVIGKDSTNFT